MRLTAAAPTSFAPASREVETTPEVRTHRWAVPYLVVATVLVPVVLPVLPGQTAPIDFVNVLAMVAFAVGLLRGADSVRLPLLAPLLLIGAGSLLATTAAISLSAAGIAMAQDLYLFLWFVMLVSLIGDETGDARGIRVAWLWTANLVAVLALAGVAQAGGIGAILNLKGARAAGTLYNPNMCADYLVLSVFNVLGLQGQVRGRWLVPSLGLLMVALMATKSNGGWISLAAGLACWLVLRVLWVGGSSPRLASLAVLAIAGVLATGWLMVEQSDTSKLRGVFAGTFVVRMDKSTQSRSEIWQSLGEDLHRSPLGIGPGNSSQRVMGIGQRRQPDSFMSKEAHSDFIGYLSERGPLALVGLIAAIAAIVARVVGGFPALVLRTGDTRRAEVIRAALMGAVVAAVVHSLVIERLHFRHGWMFLGLLWALTGPPPRMDTATASWRHHRRADGYAMPESQGVGA